MELGAIENQKQLRPRGIKCELRLNVSELGEDGKPTERCYSHLLKVAEAKIRKFNSENTGYFALHNISKVEWITEYLPIIRFTYYATPEEIVDED